MKVVTSIFIGIAALLTVLTVPSLSFNERSSQEIYSESAEAIVVIARKTGGRGTGFFIDSKGWIITNCHVVGQETEMIVTLKDGTELEAKVLYRNPRTDLALVEVKMGDYQVLELAPGLPRIGDTVYALGNPLFLRWLFTRGMLSQVTDAHERVDFLTDLRIWPGNSGGPLLNTAGKVLGVTGAVYTGFDNKISLSSSVQHIHELIWEYKYFLKYPPVIEISGDIDIEEES
jgi:S1-C subfamily serine protease